MGEEQASRIPPAGVRPDSGQDAEEKRKQKPSLGRIVLYRHELYSANNGCAPAIVTGIHSDGTVDLTVFLAGQAPYCFSCVKEGPEEGQWLWPPRV